MRKLNVMYTHIGHFIKYTCLLMQISNWPITVKMTYRNSNQASEWKKRDLSDTECVMVLSARLPCLSISDTADLLQPSQGFTENESKKMSSSSICECLVALLMSEVRGDYPDCFEVVGSIWEQ